MVLGRKRERRYLRGIKRGVTGRERERGKFERVGMGGENEGKEIREDMLIMRERALNEYRGGVGDREHLIKKRERGEGGKRMNDCSVGGMGVNVGGNLVLWREERGITNPPRIPSKVIKIEK